MYRKTTLDNGLRVITSAYPQTRSVTVAVFLAAGPKYEEASQAGVSHFLEHLVFKGTRRWPTSQQVSEAIEGVGGMLNGGTDKEATVYWCKVAHSHLQLAVDLLADLVRWPRMDPAEAERERPIIFEEINMCWDSPQTRVDMLADELVWPDQALGRDIAGTKETVGALGHQAVLDYMSSRYLPNNAVVAVAGKVRRDDAERRVRQAFSSWHAGPSLPGQASDDRQDAPRLRVEHRATEQVNLCLAARGVGVTHPDRFKIDILNAVLGEGMSSRLFVEVREKRGLAYDIHSAATHFTDTGSINVYAGVEPRRLVEAVQAILEELSRLKEGIPEAEVTKAKEMAKGRLMLRMEDTRNLVSWLGSQELIAGRVLTPDDVVAQVDAITPSDLEGVARRLLVTEKLSLAAVGPVQPGSLSGDMLRL